MKRILQVIAMMSMVLGYVCSVSAEECRECVEVAKGKIPVTFLDRKLKELPSGIKIWDSPEAIAAMNDSASKVLWVDTRPKSFFVNGTVKNAVNLFYDMKGGTVPESEKNIELNGERLKAAIEKIDPDPAKVTVAFFCQGPECHRSYNASLRSLSDFGVMKTQIVWFRDGYPGLLEYIGKDPKLNKKMGKYIQGNDVNE